MKYVAKNLAFCGVLAAAFCVFGLFTGKAEALTDATITNSAPIVASSNLNANGNTKMQPWFAVGTGKFDGAVSYVKIYVLNNTSATFTIQMAPCADDLGTPDVTYMVWKLDTSENFAGALPYGLSYHRTGNTNCTGGDITYILNADNAHSTYIGHEAFNVFLLDVEEAPQAGDNSHSFRTHINGNNFVGVAAPVRNFGAASWFGIFQHDSPVLGGTTNASCVGSGSVPAGCNWDYAVQFAPNCAQDVVNTPEKVEVYDIDDGVFNQPTLQSYIRQDPKGGTFNWVDSADGFYDPPGNPPPSSNATYAHRAKTDPLPQYRFVQGNHSRNDLSMISNNQFRYKLYFMDFWYDNTIQITLPFDQFNASLPAGSCPVNPISSGDLNAASCTQISGHIWFDEADTTTATFGRLHINDTTTGQAFDTAKFGTTYTIPHSNGGHKFVIDPFRYTPGVAPGPGIDVQLNYHDHYSIILQVPDGAGGWQNAASPSGPASLNLEYPCIYGTIGAACQAVTGDLTYKSNASSGNATGKIYSTSSVTSFQGRAFPAHTHYGNSGDLSGTLDPFKPADMNGQNLPHLVITFVLYFKDIDGNFYPTLTSTGASQVTVPLTPCLTWGPCLPNPVSFEVTSNTVQSFTMQYTNNTSAAIGGYTGRMNSNDTVRINYPGNPPGTGPLNSVGPAIAVGTSDLTWPNVTVSGTGSPDYGGYITMQGYYNGSAIAAATCPTVGTPPVPGISVFQVTKPYFKAFGASVSVGGGFASSSSPSSPVCGGSPKQAGVRAFAHFVPYDNNSLASYVGGNQKSGASVEYSIQSLGLIQGTNINGLGFYSGDNHEPPNSINTLDVGDPAVSWGGNLGGGHCVQDYYDAKYVGSEANFSTGQSIDDMVTGPNGALNNLDANGIHTNAQAFQANPGAGNSVVLVGGTLPRNTRVTLFVKGNVYITAGATGGITYAAGNYDPTATNPDGSNPTAPPYFTLIATGNIYVDSSVSELDGLYVAQGGVGGTGDGFSTCGNPADHNSNMPKLQIGVGSNCTSKLTVNGSVVASQLKLLRIGGANNTLNKSAGFDNGSSLAGKHNNSVEEFNYTPNMLENSPYYINPTANSLGNTEKTYSLPPVY